MREAGLLDLLPVRGIGQRPKNGCHELGVLHDHLARRNGLGAWAYGISSLSRDRQTEGARGVLWAGWEMVSSYIYLYIFFLIHFGLYCDFAKNCTLALEPGN